MKPKVPTTVLPPSGFSRSRTAPKVEEGERSIRPAEDVAGLEIAVDDGRRAPVQVAEHRRRVAEEAAHLGLVEHHAAAAQRGEALALDLLGDQEEIAALLEVLHVARDLRVIEPGEDGGLALGQLHVLPAPRAAHAEALDGDRAPARGVDRVEGRGLATFAEHAVEAVAVAAERPERLFRHGAAPG
jgi:hypothetical protein